MFLLMFWEETGEGGLVKSFGYFGSRLHAKNGLEMFRGHQLPQFSVQSHGLRELLRLEVQGKEHDRKLEVETAAFKELSC